jgi:outer membrane immunogenic protein
MKVIAFSAALAIATLSLAQSASAQTAQTGQSTSNWTGPFVGVQGGWEQNNVRNPATAIGTTPVTRTGDTGTLGVFMGYDKEVYPRIVVGAQAEVNFPIDSRFGGQDASIRTKRSVDLSLRAGYLVTPKTLIYARGGYSNALVEGVAATPTSYLRASDDRDGWLVGGGVERKITDRVSARLEYRYTDFSEGQGKFDRHQVLAGVSYHF